jgi:hypothetical protein
MRSEIYGDIKKLLEKKTIWVVKEEGWYYTTALDIFFDEESAIAYWESLTKVKYSKEKYKEVTSNYNSNYQGFHYYGIEKGSLEEVFQDLDNRLVKNTIYKESQKIYEKGNRELELKVSNDCNKQTREIINGMIYYLDKCGLYDDSLFNKNELRNAFWKYTDKINK